MIVIDSDHYGAHGIETMFFPGDQQPHCKIPDIEGDILLFLKLRNWMDVGVAACVIDALSRGSTRLMSVFIPFFPGARQDKMDKGKYPFTLELMIKLLLINTTGARGHYRNPFTPVVFDPHSKVLTNMWPFIVFDLIDLNIPRKSDVAGIIAPDAGALNRAEDFRLRFYPKTHLVMCSKNRDAKTGGLSGYRMDKLPKEGRYLIVDDICDGGGTFNLLAKEFCKDPLGDKSKLELIVSHGIFSKGLPAIDKKIEHITTTNSFCGPVGIYDRDRLTVLRLEQLFPKIEELI